MRLQILIATKKIRMQPQRILPSIRNLSSIHFTSRFLRDWDVSGDPPGTRREEDKGSSSEMERALPVKSWDNLGSAKWHSK